MNQTKTVRWGIHVVAIVELEVKPECDDEEAIEIVETYIRLTDVSDGATRKQAGFRVIDIDHWRIWAELPDHILFQPNSSYTDVSQLSRGDKP